MTDGLRAGGYYVHLLTVSEAIVHLGTVVAVIGLGGFALGYDLFFLNSLTCLVYALHVLQNA